ncbi:hypothetical protein KP509_26G040300 [Ceratopteris richardii]|uniref:Uncharacterized protein n=1 Tax=Ceratopteris richardii TaxID=49495 RepID=A0A8T2RLA3_CERRI|nr:hypothetical protein KP509_26G040300 [Ceratopteris richardii]
MMHNLNSMTHPLVLISAPANVLPVSADRSSLMVNEELEESGWTSYLESEYKFRRLPVTASQRSLGDTHGTLSTESIPISAEEISVLPIANAMTPNGFSHSHGQIVTSNCIDTADLVDHQDEESCGSSTLSDANSSSEYSQRRSVSLEFRRRKIKKRKQSKRCCRRNSVCIRESLEDTAKSTSDRNQSNTCSIPGFDDTSGFQRNHPQSEVLKRFKALEAFIPALKEAQMR